MNETIALLLVGLLIFIVQCKYDHRNRDLAALARRNTWLAWQAMHPELFAPGSKGDRLDRAFSARTNQPPTRQPAATARQKLDAKARQLLLALPQSDIYR